MPLETWIAKMGAVVGRLTNAAVTIERRVDTDGDSEGGEAPQWSAIDGAAAVPCLATPGKPREVIDGDRVRTLVEWQYDLGTFHDARPGDRVAWVDADSGRSRYAIITALENLAMSRGAWVLYAREWLN